MPAPRSKALKIQGDSVFHAARGGAWVAQEPGGSKRATARRQVGISCNYCREQQARSLAMTIHLNMQQKGFVGIHGEARAMAESMSASRPGPELTRSAKNLLIWQSYLPRECVESMINMGWDHST